MNNFDIIIIGAGSAGSILVSKLSENKKLKILILESGPKDYHPMIKIPLGYGMTFYNKEINWNFYSKAQKQLNDREIYMPRGKVLGGSGSINAMVYTRGLKTDFKDCKDFSKQILPKMLGKIFTYETKDFFIDIGTETNYKKANEHCS